MSEIDPKYLVAMTGIITVGVIEAAALMKGIDGTYLSVVIGAITTIVGFVFGYKQGSKQ